jgi:hypothetical protein
MVVPRRRRGLSRRASRGGHGIFKVRENARSRYTFGAEMGGIFPLPVYVDGRICRVFFHLRQWLPGAGVRSLSQVSLSFPPAA